MDQIVTRFIEINHPITFVVHGRDILGLTERNWMWIVGVLSVGLAVVLAAGFLPR